MASKLFRYAPSSELKYELLPAKLPKLERVLPRKAVTLLHPKPDESIRPSGIRSGDAVSAGDRLCLFPDPSSYVVSSFNGRVSSLTPYAGNYGRRYTAITIEIDEPDPPTSEGVSGLSLTPSLKTAREFFANLPGAPQFMIFSEPDIAIHTIIIRGIDDDLLIHTNQYVLRARMDELSSGIRWLKTITGVERVILVTPRETVQGYGHLGAEVAGVEPTFPAALQEMLMLQVLGQELPAGLRCENLGVSFFSAESVAAIGAAFESGYLRSNKILTLIDKNGRRRLVETPIGTPVRDLFEHYALSVNDEDQIIFGGPMRGSAVYSIDHPVQPDTDGIMILDRFEAARTTEYPCVNCGDCIRVCPARMPINLLVRFLEAGQYETAADSYDLYSCIECGLCSYVCISKIPILQFIKLAKHELERAKNAEAGNA